MTTAQQVINGLDAASTFIKAAAPLAAAAGPQGSAIATIVSGVADWADEVAHDLEGDAAIYASEDVPTIRTALAALQAENSTLAAQVAAS